MKKTIFFIIILFQTSVCFAQINTDRLLNIGANALYFKDYVLSIQYFNQIIRAKPYLDKPYLYRAIAKINLEDYVGALADLNIAIDKNEFIPMSYYARGYVRNRLGNYKDAEQDFSKALELNPDNTDYIIGRLESLDFQKKYDSELKDINFLLRKIGKEPQLALEKGRVQVLLGDTVGAFNTMDSLVRSDSTIAGSWGGRALINMLLDRNDSALNDYNKAIALKSDNFSHFVNRGILEYKNKNYRGAIADYNRAVELSPNDEQALFNRSLLMFEVGDYNNALKDLNKLVEINPELYEAVYQRGIINQKLGNHSQAITDFTKIIEQYPKFSPVYFARAASFQALQNKKAAFNDMQTVIKIDEEHNKNKGQEAKNKNEEIDTNAKISQDKSKVNDWAKLFAVTDANGKSNTFANDRIRGNVQNRNVEAAMEKDFVLSPYKEDGEINTANYFFVPLNEFNRNNGKDMLLRFVNDEIPLTNALINYHFKNIDRITDKIQKDSLNADNYFVRGENYFLVRDFNNAIEDFSKAISLKNNALYYFGRAFVRQKQLEVDMANSVKDAPATGKYAVSPSVDEKKFSHEYEMILRDYDKALELAPEFPFAWFNRANLLCSVKDYQTAIDNYTKAVEIFPSFAEAYFNRALTYIYLGDTEKGIADLSKAGELGVYQAYNLIKKLRK